MARYLQVIMIVIYFTIIYFFIVQVRKEILTINFV